MMIDDDARYVNNENDDDDTCMWMKMMSNIILHNLQYKYTIIYNIYQ
jgi:hypothetical protein